MKYFETHPKSSIRLSDDPRLRTLLRDVISSRQIDGIIETGTYDGLGSTLMLAKSFQEPPRRWRPPPRVASFHSQTFPPWSKVPQGLAEPVYAPVSDGVPTAPKQFAVLGSALGAAQTVSLSERAG